jgi:hypothetical protein
VASCDPAAGCRLDPLPDGAECPSDDLCIPGACNGGTCVPPNLNAIGHTANAHFLAVSQLVVRGSAGRRRLTARASFAVGTLIDPTIIGGALEFHRPSGEMIYDAAIPGPIWHANRSRQAFRYAVASGRRAPASAHGLTKLVVHVRGAIADVSLSGSSAELDAITTEPTLAIVLRLGDACVRDPALDCRATAASTSCL